mgnify:FL=1
MKRSLNKVFHTWLISLEFNIFQKFYLYIFLVDASYTLYKYVFFKCISLTTENNKILTLLIAMHRSFQGKSTAIKWVNQAIYQYVYLTHQVAMTLS